MTWCLLTFHHHHHHHHYHYHHHLLGTTWLLRLLGATVIQSEECIVDTITNTNTNSSDDDVAFTAIRPQPVTTITTTTTTVDDYFDSFIEEGENWADAVYYCAVPTIIPPPPPPSPPSPLGDNLAAAVRGYYSNSKWRMYCRYEEYCSDSVVHTTTTNILPSPTGVDDLDSLSSK